MEKGKERVTPSVKSQSVILMDLNPMADYLEERLVPKKYFKRIQIRLKSIYTTHIGTCLTEDEEKDIV